MTDQITKKQNLIWLLSKIKSNPRNIVETGDDWIIHDKKFFEHHGVSIRSGKYASRNGNGVYSISKDGEEILKNKWIYNKNLDKRKLFEVWDKNPKQIGRLFLVLSCILISYFYFNLSWLEILKFFVIKL